MTLRRSVYVASMESKNKFHVAGCCRESLNNPIFLLFPRCSGGYGVDISSGRNLLVEFQFHYRETKGIGRRLQRKENGRVRESVVHRSNLVIRRPVAREGSTLKKSFQPSSSDCRRVNSFSCFFSDTSIRGGTMFLPYSKIIRRLDRL